MTRTSFPNCHDRTLTGFGNMYEPNTRILINPVRVARIAMVIRKHRTITFLIACITIVITLTATASAQTIDVDKNRLRAAQNLERRGSYDAALRIFRSLYDLVPQNQLYYEGVKRNMLRLKLYDELTEIINSQINLSRGNNPRFWADLGNVNYKRGDHEQAMNIWNTLLAQVPRQKSAYIYVANAMIENRLYDEAIEVYQNARHAFGQNHLFVFELANIYVLRLKYREATLEYLRFLEKNPGQFSYIEGRIAAYTKDSEQAREVAEVLRSHIPESKQEFFVRKLLANLYLRIENFEMALQEFKFLETVKAPNQNQRHRGKELYFFAEKSLRAGQYQFAKDAFELILINYNKSPYRPRALYGLAVSKQMQGLSDEALTSFNELIKTYPTSRWIQDAFFQIGEIYFQGLFELDKALSTYHSLLQKFPNGKNTVQAHFRIGDCYAAKGDLEKAQLWYDRTSNIGRATLAVRDEALFKSANLDFMRGDFEKALEKLQKITEKISQGQGQQPFVNDALELTFLIEENQSDSRESLAVYGKAQQYKLQRKQAEAIQSLQEILNSYPSAAIIDESLFALGELENERANYTAAIGYFQNLLHEHPESLQNELAQKRIAEIYESGLGDHKKAYEAYEQLLINFPNSVYLEEVRQKLRKLLSRRLSN